MKGIKSYLYLVSCKVHKLRINKGIKFETKVMWRRNQKKAETRTVKHLDSFSEFQETLSLEFDMPFNTDSLLFEQKNTELVAVIMYQGKVKSGGYAKYNIADNLNKAPNETTRISIPLTQCPDPSAYIDVSFTYERISSEPEDDRVSVFQSNVGALDMSRVDFKDDRLSMEMEKISRLINKFEVLGDKVAQKASKRKQSDREQLIFSLQEEKHSLLESIEKLQTERQKKDRDLALQSQSLQYKELYEHALRQIQELRASNSESRHSIDLKVISNLKVSDKAIDLESREDASQQLKELSRQNAELQVKVASMSHKLAQLFNASYEFGGAKLLDYLQTSIGLTEME